jgi:predicted short-subunit dehydrogenase-like oxidoreductase (DUF2520 family)
MNFGIIGAGIVGTVVAIRLKQSGHRLVGVHTRSESSYARFCHYLSWEKRPLEEWVREADVLFITTQDGMIRLVAEELAKRELYQPNQIWVHCSGSMSSRVLQVDNNMPVRYLSLHPLQAFAGIEQAVASLSGTHFGIEGDEEAVGLKIVNDLGGIPHLLKPEGKPLYHAGAVVASNYLVSLAGLAVQLFEQAGVSKKEALESLIPLMEGTLRNLSQVGLPQALTGPIERGDVEVVRSHLEQMPVKIEPAYRALGLYTLEMGLKKKDMNGEVYSKEVWENLNQLLKQ